MAKFRRERYSIAPPARRATTPIDTRPANAIIGAAQRIMPDTYRNMRIPTSEWQNEAWNQYSINGELAFGCRWLGNSLSRCRLTAVEVAPDGEILGPASGDEGDRVVQILKGFVGSPGKQAELMMQLGTHMTVPGDCYVVATVDRDGHFEKWAVHSTDEVRNHGAGQISIDIGDGDPRVYDLNSTLVIRVYRPHPRKSWQADSPTRSALPVLKEIEQLSKHIFAVIDSRLAGAGILLLPSELDFPSPGDDIKPGETPFIALLSQAMMTSIADRGDARAVVPIVAQGPKDAISGAQWLVSPAADLTMVAADLREKAIRRLAIDLDMPPEVLLGVSGSNNWSAWAIEEQSVKLHVEPLMILICSALTEGYFKPALEAEGIDPLKYAIWFDSSSLVLRPNRATDAKDLYDRGEISGTTLRRETGFSEQDAPEGKEKAIRDIERALKAAPQIGDHVVKALIELLDLARYVSPEALEPVEADQAGGTPPKEGPPPEPNVDPKAPPAPGGRNSDGG